MIDHAAYYKKKYELYEKKFINELKYSESLKVKLSIEVTQRKLYELECTRLTEKLNKNIFKRLFNL